jgi:hypothetical protein
MKFLLLAFLSLGVISCASKEDRLPSSVDQKDAPKDVSRGINTDYYGGGFR